MVIGSMLGTQVLWKQCLKLVFKRDMIVIIEIWQMDGGFLRFKSEFKMNQKLITEV
jgi:hypothetical protein